MHSICLTPFEDGMQRTEDPLFSTYAVPSANVMRHSKHLLSVLSPVLRREHHAHCFRTNEQPALLVVESLALWPESLVALSVAPQLCVSC